jgi:hypothetical protein
LALKRTENRGDTEEASLMQNLEKTLKKELENSVCIHSEDCYYGKILNGYECCIGLQA